MNLFSRRLLPLPGQGRRLAHCERTVTDQFGRVPARSTDVGVLHEKPDARWQVVEDLKVVRAE
jgi:hypothetical protein